MNRSPFSLGDRSLESIKRFQIPIFSFLDSSDAEPNALNETYFIYSDAKAIHAIHHDDPKSSAENIRTYIYMIHAGFFYASDHVSKIL